MLFDILSEDGTRSSSRKVPIAEMDVLEEAASAKAILETQDRRVAALSGRSPRAVKSIDRVS